MAAFGDFASLVFATGIAELWIALDPARAEAAVFALAFCSVLAGRCFVFTSVDPAAFAALAETAFVPDVLVRPDLISADFNSAAPAKLLLAAAFLTGLDVAATARPGVFARVAFTALDLLAPALDVLAAFAASFPAPAFAALALAALVLAALVLGALALEALVLAVPLLTRSVVRADLAPASLSLVRIERSVDRPAVFAVLAERAEEDFESLELLLRDGITRHSSSCPAVETGRLGVRKNDRKSFSQKAVRSRS